ncbi:MAG: LCP family protein [Anaerolineae bacterium]|nr:LCP family protein [Anaerolineae bacterium]
MLSNFPPNKPRRPSGLLVIIALVVAVVVFPGVGLIALNAAQRLIEQISPRSNTGAPIVVNQLAKWEGQERITILVLGIDQRPNESPSIARTDTMILLTLDPLTQSAGMMSIPRDLFVPMPDGRQDRINTAHVYGGPQFAMKTVEYNFGIPIQHYARVNFRAVEELITLLGGIDVYNDQEINDPTFPDANYGYEPFYLPAGFQHLDGKTALKYARTRHGAGDDYGRMRRQQQVIMALREKLVGTDAATKLLPNTPTLLRSLSNAIETDLSATQIVQLALYVKDNIPKERIVQAAIDESATQPWTTPEGASVLIPIRDKVRELRERLYNVPQQPGSVAESAATAEPTEPNTGRIAIQNGTQTVGLAGGAKAFLESKGYVVDSVSDAPQVPAKTIVVSYHRRAGFVQRLVAELGVPAEAVVDAYDPNNPLDALVVLGDDYAPK